MMKIAVLGFEREGQSTLQFILRDPAFRGAEIWVLDKKEDIRVPKGVHAKLGKDYMSDLDGFDLIFRTPGVRYYAPEIQHAIGNEARSFRAQQNYSSTDVRRGSSVLPAQKVKEPRPR